MQYAGDDLQKLRNEFTEDLKKIDKANARLDTSDAVIGRGIQSWNGLGHRRVAQIFSFLAQVSDRHKAQSPAYDVEGAQESLDYLQRSMPSNLNSFREILEREIKSLSVYQARMEVCIKGPRAKVEKYTKYVPFVFKAAKAILRPVLDCKEEIALYASAYLAVERITQAWESKFVPVMKNIVTHCEQQEADRKSNAEDVETAAREYANARFRETMQAARAKSTNLQT